MTAESNEFTTTILRLGKSLVIHLFITSLALTVAFWLTSHFEDASNTLRNNYAGDPSSSTSIMALLEDARGHFIKWLVACFLTSFLASGLFISQAQRRRPNSAREGRSGRWYWGFLVGGIWAAAGGLLWLYVSRSDVGASVMVGNFTAILAAGFVGSTVAYYLATALAVTITMKPSVPFAGFLPNVWN